MRQGYLDIELADGNAISHDVDLVAFGSKCVVSVSQTLITPEGRDVLQTTGDIECVSFVGFVDAITRCESFIRRIERLQKI